MELTLIKDVLTSILLLVAIWMAILMWAVAFSKNPPKDSQRRRTQHLKASRIALVLLVALMALGIVVSDFFSEIYGAKTFAHIIVGSSVTAVVITKIAIKRKFKKLYSYLKWLGIYALCAVLFVWTLMVALNVL